MSNRRHITRLFAALALVGGNTAVAASDVIRSPADGYTILSADNGTMVFNSALYAKLSYNPEKDLTPLTLMGNFGIEPVGSTSQQYADLIRTEVKRWHKLIRDQKISLG